MITSDIYRQIMGNWATGVTIVTTAGRDGAPSGLTVSSFTSVSIDPILVLVCLDNRYSALQEFKDSMTFGVSILADDQEDVSRLFAKKDTLRPSDLYVAGNTGVPLLKGALATLECRTTALFPGGGHTIFLGQVEAGDVSGIQAGKKPLLYCRGKYQRLAE